MEASAPYGYMSSASPMLSGSVSVDFPCPLQPAGEVVSDCVRKDPLPPSLDAVIDKSPSLVLTKQYLHSANRARLFQVRVKAEGRRVHQVQRHLGTL